MYELSPAAVVDISVRPFKLKTVRYFDLLDIYLDVLKVLSVSHFRDLDYSFLIFFQREYIMFLIPNVSVFNEIKTCFLIFSQDIELNIQTFVVMFIMILVGIKTFELIQLFFLYKIVNKLASIFLRINQNEAIRELNFIDSFLEFHEKEEDYFYMPLYMRFPSLFSLQINYF